MHYCLVILFSVLAHIISPQISGTLKGKVIDSRTNHPISGVYVIYGKNAGVITDDTGEFIIETDSTSLNVTFQIIGYKSVTRSFQIPSGQTTETEIRMEMKMEEISQVVVSASRNDQKIAELSVSMDIVKTRFLSDNHITDPQEIITRTPGIEIMDGQTSIRGGSGFSYGAGSRVIALIDGLPMLSADAANIKWQFLPLENIAQIEIIKGASSVLYGSSALNGVINFRTADPGIKPSTNFYIESGLYGKPSNRNWIWWDRPRSFASASFSHLQKFGNTDLGIGFNILSDEGYRRLNEEKLGRFNLKVKHTSSRINGLSFGINLNSGLTNKRDFVLWENADSGALKQSESTAVKVRGTFLTADPYVSFKKSNRYKHDLRMRMQVTENFFPQSAQNNSKANSLFTEYQGWFRLSQMANLTVGFSETYNVVKSRFYGDHTGTNLAAFTQIELEPVNRLKAVGGIRVEHNALDKQNDKIVPVLRLGLNWQAADYTFLRASFGQGYRFPSIAEKFASTTLGSVKIIPNPSIQPESGWSTEAGIKQGIAINNLTGQVDLAMFLLQNKDIIEFMFGLYPQGGLGFRATNVEMARVYGYEFEYILNRQFSKMTATMSGGYTFTYPAEYNINTRENTGNYLKYRRKHSGKIGLSASWPKFDISSDLFIKSKILNIDDVFLDPSTREALLPGFYDYWLANNKGYFLADISAGYRIRKFKISFAVKNLTNSEYMGRPGDIQPQRNYSLRISGNY